MIWVSEIERERERERERKRITIKRKNILLKKRKKERKKMFKYEIHNLLHASGKKLSHYHTVFLTIIT